jgi:hypothetical protein
VYDKLRQLAAAKRGSGMAPIELAALDFPSPAPNDDALLKANETLKRFAHIDPRKAELVKLQCFISLSFEETNPSTEPQTTGSRHYFRHFEKQMSNIWS